MGWHGPDSCVTTPRRSHGYAFVAAPWIRGRGTPNAGCSPSSETCQSARITGAGGCTAVINRLVVTRFLWAWGPATVWATVIFSLSSVRWTDAPIGFEINDKLVHFGIFAVFGITLAHAGGRMPGRLGHGALLAMGILYALSDEFHQSFVPGRTPSLGDLVADTVGLAVGYAGFFASTTWRGTRSMNGSTGND